MKREHSAGFSLAIQVKKFRRQLDYFSKLNQDSETDAQTDDCVQCGHFLELLLDVRLEFKLWCDTIDAAFGVPTILEF